MDALNFVTTDQVNAISHLMGSDKRVPTLYDVPLIEEATSGNFMDKGALRQAVRQGSDFYHRLEHRFARKPLYPDCTKWLETPELPT